MSKKNNGINPDLEKAVSELLKSMNTLDIDEKLKIIDRAINLEKLKQKVSEDEIHQAALKRIDEKLSALGKSGVLMIDGTNVVIHIKFEKGSLTVNQHPFDPSWLIV